jgi:hypothetical protein
MTTTDTRSTKELFRQWRSGDADAGQVMAQRFADWYYAVATSRLGEKVGREPCEKACARFGEGVIKQNDARALVKWAHDIIQEEVSTAGGRTNDGDEATSYTGGQKPKELLIRARKALPGEVRLVEACYTGRDEGEIARLAEPLGGMPIGVLKARYRIKQWMRDNAKVPFEVAPNDPVLDRAPLPLYESGRMASPAEEANFEQWMLSDLDLCKDIAEFAQFAIALRGGLPAEAASSSKPQAGQSFQGAPSGADEGSSTVGTAGKAAIGGVALLGVGALAVVLVLIVVLAVVYLFVL